MYFNGLEVIINNSFGNQVQRRTHKKHRINKKWLKRYGYKFVSDGRTFIFDNKIIMHQDTWNKIKKLIPEKIR